MIKCSYGGVTMLNFNNKKTQRKIAAVIAIILVLAMVIPLFAYILG